MRYKSKRTQGYVVFAVTGVNTVSFAIDASQADTKDLLGFAVERVDPWPTSATSCRATGVRRWFHSRTQRRREHLEHPVQASSGTTSARSPARPTNTSSIREGQAEEPRARRPGVVKVRTDRSSRLPPRRLFNRGVASSQATRGASATSATDEAREAQGGGRMAEPQARRRDLRLHRQREEGADTLCAASTSSATSRSPSASRPPWTRRQGAVIIDAKKNESTDKKGVFHESFPREDNLATIKDAGSPKAAVIRREPAPASSSTTSSWFCSWARRRLPPRLDGLH